MKKLLLSVVILLLAGCAASAKYEAFLGEWVGASELEVVRRWGPPVQVYEVEESKFLVYSSSRNVTFPGSPPIYTTRVVGRTLYTDSYGGTPAQNVTYACQTVFEMVDGKVMSWSYKGNDCAAF